MKKNKDTDIKLYKNILIIFEVAVLLTVVVVTVAVMSGNLSFGNNKETTLYVTQAFTDDTTNSKSSLTLLPDDNKSNSNNAETQNGGSSQGGNNLVSGNQSSLADPSGWSTKQIISKAKDAVNKTKAYKGNLTVDHNESFTADVTDCSAGGIVRSVVDLMIGWVVKPVEETLVFQNGKAVNSEGETVPIILPKRNNFSLDSSGVKSASVQRVGNEYVIKITLVEESVGMYQVPKHNAGAVGYLDVANFDISFMEVDSADIVYKGSSIELRINAEGYVTYANYKIPLHIDGSAHRGSISGSATFEGEQTEEWYLNF